MPFSVHIYLASGGETSTNGCSWYMYKKFELYWNLSQFMYVLYTFIIGDTSEQNVNEFTGTCCICIIIDRVALAKQGDNVLGSVRPSVRPSVRHHSHGWTEVFVCVLSCLADAVDRLLIAEVARTGKCSWFWGLGNFVRGKFYEFMARGPSLCCIQVTFVCSKFPLKSRKFPAYCFTVRGRP